MTEAKEPLPAPLVQTLGRELALAGVRFCHWKSNATIERAERGETDLDILYASDQADQFMRVLRECGFIRARRPALPDFPGMSHFFGYDTAVDRFIHVHAHDRLVVGHDRTKNYRLPIEGPFLDSVSERSPMPLPSPEFEYAVLCVRMVLKYAIVDEVLWAKLRGRSAGPSASEIEEFRILAERIDREVLAGVVSDYLPFVGTELFERAELFASGQTNARNGFAVAKDMHRALRDQARVPALGDAMGRVIGRLRMSARRWSGSKRGFVPLSRGAIIAILGGDGAGKSTALDHLEAWLGDRFDVMRVHLGKPRWSVTTWVLRGILWLASLAVAGEGTKVEPVPLSDDEEDGTVELTFPVVRRFLWLATKSRDRYLVYRRSRRAADLGQVVITDRYPHSALRLMDVPQIERMSRGEIDSRLIRGLIAIENYYHGLIDPPDLTAVLRVEPEVAVRRKTDEPQEYVKRRSAEVWNADWEGLGVAVVDAGESSEVVAANLKKIIWDYFESQSQETSI